MSLEDRNHIDDGNAELLKQHENFVAIRSRGMWGRVSFPLRKIDDLEFTTPAPDGFLRLLNDLAEYENHPLGQQNLAGWKAKFLTRILPVNADGYCR